jgi:Gluconate 2-dehydrogenase subunit 3
MNSRRETLRLLVITPAVGALGLRAQETKEVESQPGHLRVGPTVQVPVPSQPTFFQPAEFQTVEALSECIIPESDTPGAKKAGVALLIDKAIVAEPGRQNRFRVGISDLNAASITDYGKTFTELTEEQKTALLTRLSLESSSTPLGSFFMLVKDMTVDAYYKTEAGLKTELGWHGNTYLPSFPGCNHPEHES